MEKKIFNPADWLPKEAPAPEVHTQPKEHSELSLEIEYVIQQIEKHKIDIAPGYIEWRNTGFAFGNTLGEEGRNYFHRISCFYQGYTTTECNNQYDNCLKAKRGGITLKTFFYYAKSAGLKIFDKEPSDDSPPFPEPLFPELPELLQQVVAIAATPEEKDILLLGSIVALGSCFPKLFGIYDGKKVFANLFLFITAQASAGKGRMVHCKQLVNQVHKKFREQTKLMMEDYNDQMKEYNKSKKVKEESTPKPAKPPERMLFIPANNSTTGVFQLLNDNEGRGLIFETEGDTLAQAFKTDYGNYSDGFRKAFHHETISYFRRTDREYVDIEHPCLSTVLSGTPKQIASLIPSAENGLFSRFIFYFMNVQPVWKDVFLFSNGNALDEYFDNLGNTFFRFYQVLEANEEIQFSLTADQQQQFNSFFKEVQETFVTLNGLDYMATVRRLGLICFRIAMILSVLRLMETGEITTHLVCEERDFQLAQTIIKVLVQHATKVFSELPEEKQSPKRKNQKEKFLDALPTEFNRQIYLKTAVRLKINEKTAEGYITDFCKKQLLHREKKDYYIKLEVEETQEIKKTEEI